MFPVIGINCAYLQDEESAHKDKLHLYRPYVQAVEKSGGLPILLPVVSNKDLVTSYMDLIDGLLMTGGGGLHPKFDHVEPLPGLEEQNPIRHQFDTMLVEQALNRDLPVLGICRGHQSINEVAGGTTRLSIRDTAQIDHSQTVPREECTHEIRVVQGTALYELLGKETISVNSLHRQVVDQLAPGFRASAWSEDYLLEAFESSIHTFVMGVQFHPENLMEINPFWKIYRALIKAARNGIEKYIK
ncbi:gamma-glutamyl-gamma-aminobutyrate hydrolase family protein [Metallumcola ferriviriculae]|uniref:Gamma-glutamyl-gamma-aminobutyrate hydrolase family protein n=1 Tax=Metallumcola ferriviriculae TaxID=3039180 RepID=A0AAU0UN90_9FIRM|nr:gamma-glutamyl-gamma-aminobutyrate hydrolase family protein [Desulfitibacteraceae bacterium MK1]